MNWSDITCALNPTWPDWLPDTAALPTFLGAAALLAILTLWTYLGKRDGKLGRVIIVLTLRLAALAIALLVALRPSLGVEVYEGLEPSKLLIVVDASESMTIPDEFNSQSRWETARRILLSRTVADALKRLSAEEQIEVVYYQGAESLANFDPQGAADGKRTDIGAWLHELHQKHVGQDKLRGVLLFSDGADNGTRFPTLDEARRWRGTCPIWTFGHGKPQDDEERKDIAVASVKATPSPVPAKTKLKITGLVHAPGFKDFVVKVEVWAQGSRDKEPVLLGDVEKRALKDVKNNEIVLVRDAPETPDEYKLTFKVEKMDGEADITNNEATTFVQVTKEGVSVLWVEARKRAFEPVFAMRVLGRDKRFRLFFAESAARLGGRDPYEFEKRQYDVVVIGDLSSQQFGDKAAIEKVRDLVRDKKVGLLMLGGIDTFGKGGWNNTPLADLLPVALDTDKQLDDPVRLQPAEAALKLKYPFLILDDDDKKNRELWDKSFGKLDGLAQLGSLREGATVLARAGDEDGPPALVAGQPAGRVLVFGGDTTWKAWLKPKTVDAYNKFWRQTILWLANQDDRAGNLWIELKQRRVSGGTLDFTFGLKGKSGIPVKNAKYLVEVIGPNGEKITVPRSVPKQDYQQGGLQVPSAPGEYRIEIHGEGKDVDGGDVSDRKSVHFLVVSDNLEMQRKAPDHDLLAEISAQSGGKFYPADETQLLKVLSELRGEVRKESRARTIRWPDWDRHPATDAWSDQFAGLWGSAAFLWFFAFAALLAGEWGLRRMWGMV